MNQYVRFEEYVQRAWLPPPFSLLVYAYNIVTFLGRKCCKPTVKRKIDREGKGSEREYLDANASKHCQSFCRK